MNPLDFFSHLESGFARWEDSIMLSAVASKEFQAICVKHCLCTWFCLRLCSLPYLRAFGDLFFLGFLIQQIFKCRTIQDAYVSCQGEFALSAIGGS